MTALIWIFSILLLFFILTLFKIKVDITYQEDVSLEISYLFFKFKIPTEKLKHIKKEASDKIEQDVDQDEINDSKKLKKEQPSDQQKDSADEKRNTTKKNEIKDEKTFREKVTSIMDIAEKTFAFSKKMLAYMNKKLICEKLELQIQMGSGDAALTAIAVGGLWGFIYTVFAVMTRYFKIAFEKPDFEVFPDYNRQNFLFHFHGIFSTRVVNIIVIGSRSLLYFLLHFKKKK